MELRAALVSFILSVCIETIAYDRLMWSASLGGISPTSTSWKAIIERLLLIVSFCSVPILVSVLIFYRFFLVSLQSAALGCTFAIGACIWKFSSSLFAVVNPFGLYLCIMAIFHWSEYIVTAVTSPRTLSLDSFLLNHSLQYWLAACASWIEFFLESWLLPVSLIGLIVCILGEAFRKGAMMTAKSNFTHCISTRKQRDHTLVVHGIYSIFRHPAYVGWFWWSVGTQIILCNPICAIAYAYVAWHFFNQRIMDEEKYLITFFGVDYVRYQQRVPVGLPYIRGYSIEEATRA